VGLGAPFERTVHELLVHDLGTERDPRYGPPIDQTAE
jgi:hypothetical protein